MKKGFLAPLILCAPFSCFAGDFFYEPVFNTNERYNSNLFMRPVPLQANWITTMSPGINLGLRHDKGELKSNFTWNEIIYDNQSQLNIAEQLFSTAYTHKDERFDWGLSGGYSNQSSITTESTISGLVFSQRMRKQLNLAPTLTYNFNELSSVTSDYSYSKTTYDKIPGSQNILSYSDYDYHQASGTFNHLYTNRDKLNATLSSSLYTTSFQTTYNNVAQLGWQHSFSEQLVTFISAGMNYATVNSQSSASQLQLVGFNAQGPIYQPQINTIHTNKISTGQIYRGTIQKTFERGSIAVAGSKNQSPTSIGLQTQTTFSINPSYSFSDRWTTGVSASYTKTEMTGLSSSPYNRTFYSFSPNINWKCSPEINLGLSYTYQQSDYQSTGNVTSMGNIAQIQFSYQPQINHQVK